MVCSGLCTLQALFVTLHADKHGSNWMTGQEGLKMRTRCQYPCHLVLPTGRHTTPCCGMDTCAWIPEFLIVLGRCFEFYFSCFVDKTL